MRQTDFAKYRQDFPVLRTMMHGKPLIYLDSAATAQKPQAVIDAISSFYNSRYATVHRAVYQLSAKSTDECQVVRHKIKTFLKASHEDEVIFTAGTTASINLVAYSFGKAFIKTGDEILVSAMEHHSNIVPWQIMCAERGAILKVIPMNDQGELLLDAYAKLLGPKTKLVAVNHVSNALGTINPIKEMARMAHASGAILLVDGAQSTPHMPIDVQDLDADFFVFSGHKVYGPTGIGVLYGKRELLEKMPPYQGGGDMVERVSFEKTTYNVLPYKFEAGTPMIAEIIGLGAAIDYLNAIGMEQIQKHEQTLLEEATKQMQNIPGVQIIGTAAKKGGIISFVVKGAHPLDIGTLLDLKGIAIRTGHHCAQPATQHFGIPATARVSFGLYNTHAEVEIFVKALHDVVKMLT